MIAEKPMIESPAACVDVPVGFGSTASARPIAREYAGGRVYIDAREGLYFRSVPAERVEELTAALERTGGADHATRFRVPETVSLSTVFMHKDGRMGILVSAPADSFSSEEIERLARITERKAFDGMSSTEDGRVVILGVDPMVVTEVMVAVEQLGLIARTPRAGNR